MKNNTLTIPRLIVRTALLSSFVLTGLFQACAQKGGSDLPLNNGCYFIQYFSGENQVLDVDNSSQEDGARILLWEKHGSDNQKFQVLDAGDGYFYFKNVNSGKAITWEGQLVQMGLVGSDQQTFKLIATDYPNAFYLAVKSEEQNDLALEPSADGKFMLKGDGRSVMGGIRAQMFRFVPCSN